MSQIELLSGNKMPSIAFGVSLNQRLKLQSYKLFVMDIPTLIQQLSMGMSLQLVRLYLKFSPQARKLVIRSI